MIDDSEKRKRQLAFDLRNMRVFEKCNTQPSCSSHVTDYE